MHVDVRKNGGVILVDLEGKLVRGSGDELLREVVNEDYLRYRLAATRYLGEGLVRRGIPIIQPPGGHAIYIDAGSFLPHIPQQEFPGQALACAFFIEGGIRGVEIGTLMFGGVDPYTVLQPVWAPIAMTDIPLGIVPSRAWRSLWLNAS